jgi:hypothetical protein
MAATTALPAPDAKGTYTFLIGPGQPYAYLTHAAVVALALSRPSGARIPKTPRCHFILMNAPAGYYAHDVGTHDPVMIAWALENDFYFWPEWDGSIEWDCTIEGQSGFPKPIIGGPGIMTYYQTGLWFLLDHHITVRNIAFSYGEDFNPVPGSIERGLFIEPPTDEFGNNVRGTGVFLLDHCEFYFCGQGLQGGWSGQNLTILDCYFHDNGQLGTGYEHGAYLGPMDSVTLKGTNLFVRTRVGHHLKCRAAKLVFATGSTAYLIGGTATTPDELTWDMESANLDMPDGGVIHVEQGAALILRASPQTQKQANWMLHYGGENQDASGLTFRAVSAVQIDGALVFINNATGLVDFNGTSGPVHAIGNESPKAPGRSASTYTITPAVGVTGSVTCYGFDAANVTLADPNHLDLYGPGFPGATLLPLSQAPAIPLIDPSLY